MEIKYKCILQRFAQIISMGGFIVMLLVTGVIASTVPDQPTEAAPTAEANTTAAVNTDQGGEGVEKSDGPISKKKYYVRSIVFLLVVLLALFILRFIAKTWVSDLQRRYFINRNLSIITAFVAIIGLLVIFVRDVSNLLTGMGVAVAGLAIALQEMVNSFFAWFVIRGSRGYRIGDWIRLGEHHGEVVDVGLFITFLAEVTPLDSQGQDGGAWTGGLTGLANANIFKKTYVNYTHGYPYIWCTLEFTFTYESDWQAAKDLILGVTDEEIITTARKARKHLEEMAADFAMKIDNTEPQIRVRAGASGIRIKLRFLANPRRRLALMDKINRQVIEAVNQTEGVEFAYDTLRVVTSPPNLLNTRGESTSD